MTHAPEKFSEGTAEAVSQLAAYGISNTFSLLASLLSYATPVGTRVPGDLKLIGVAKDFQQKLQQACDVLGKSDRPAEVQIADTITEACKEPLRLLKVSEQQYMTAYGL